MPTKTETARLWPAALYGAGGLAAGFFLGIAFAILVFMFGFVMFGYMPDPRWFVRPFAVTGMVLGAIAAVWFRMRRA